MHSLVNALMISVVALGILPLPQVCLLQSSPSMESQGIWWSEPQAWARAPMSWGNPLDYACVVQRLRSVNVTIAWGVPVDDRSYSGLYASAQRILRFQGIRTEGGLRLGMVVSFGQYSDLPLTYENGTPIANPVEEAASRDPWGRIVTLDIPAEEYRGLMTGIVLLSINNPHYFRYLKRMAELLVDSGVDSINVEVWWAWPMTLGAGSCSGDYSNSSKAMFREYLRQKYSQAELRDLLQSRDPATFDIAQYLLEKGYLSTETAYRSYDDVIWREYLFFQAESSSQRIRELVQHAKDYSLSKYGREVAVRMTQFLDYPCVYNHLSSADMLGIEQLIDPSPTLGSFGLYWNEKQMSSWLTQHLASGGKPVAGFPGLSFMKYVYESYGEIMPENMTRLLMYEALASRGALIVGCPMEYGYFYNVSASDRAANEVNTFMLENSRFYRYDGSISPYANVVVFVPSRSLMYLWNPIVDDTLFTSSGFTSSAERYLMDRRIVTEMLVDLHVPFDVMPEDELSSDTLQRYRVAILPSLFSLSEMELQSIADFVEQGGGLIITGRTSLADERLLTREDYGLASLTGVHLGHEPPVKYGTYGRGRFVYFWGAGTDLANLEGFFGSYLSKTQTGADARQEREALGDALTYTLGESCILCTNASWKVGITAFRKNRDALLLHLVNYNYDESTDAVACQERISVKLRLPEDFVTAGKVLRLYSPGIEEPLELQYNIDDDYISFTIPKLFVYSVVAFTDPEKDGAEAELDAAELALSRLECGGFLTTEARKTLGEASAAFKSCGYVDAKATALKAIEQASQRQVRIVPKIFFEEGHGEPFSISKERVEELDQKQPCRDNNDFSDFATTLAHIGYSVERVDGKILNDSVLSKESVLVIADPTTGFSASEVLAIENFVKDGGSLLLVGDRFMGEQYTPTIDDIASRFGVIFLRGTIMCPRVEWYERAPFRDQEFHTANLAIHSITTGCPSLLFSWSTALDLTADLEVVVWTENDTWLEKDFDWAQDSSEPKGPLPLLAIRSYGFGRIAAITDQIPFADCGSPIAFQLMDWLSEGMRNASAYLEAEDVILRSEAIVLQARNSSFESPSAMLLIRMAEESVDLAAQALASFKYRKSLEYSLPVSNLIGQADLAEREYRRDSAQRETQSLLLDVFLGLVAAIVCIALLMHYTRHRKRAARDKLLEDTESQGQLGLPRRGGRFSYSFPRAKGLWVYG